MDEIFSLMLRRIALEQAGFRSIASGLIGLSVHGRPLDSDAIKAWHCYDMTPGQILQEVPAPDGFATTALGPAPQG